MSAQCAGRQTLFRVQRSLGSPRTEASLLSIQVWDFRVWRPALRPGCSLVISPVTRALSKGQGPENDQRGKGRGRPAEPDPHIH